MKRPPFDVGTRVILAFDNSWVGVITAVPAPKVRTVAWDMGDKGDVHISELSEMTQ